MKTILVMLIAIGLALAGIAQEKSPRSIEGLDVIPAQFIGMTYNVNESQDANLLTQYLCDCIKNQQKLTDINFEGTEVVRFTVTEKGKIKDIVFINSVSREIDDLFITALESTSGMWKPALKGGEYHECYPEVSLTFSHLSGNGATEAYFNKQAKRHYSKACQQMFTDQNLRKAERNFSEGLNYMPYDGSMLYLRGICRYERGNIDGAMEDWTRFTDVTGLTTAPPELTLDEKQFKGVEAFAEFNKDK